VGGGGDSMILLIDNYDSFTYNLYQAIAPLVDEMQVIRNDKITLQEIEKLKPAGIILSPGPGRPEDAGICVDLIKKFAPTIPLFGVCLGHQAMAHAFGGKVIQCGEIVHGKKTSVFHNRQGIYADMPLPFAAGRYHSLIVDKASLPEMLMIEAENSEGIIMGMRHCEFPVYGVQFHPESILTPEGNLLIKRFLKITEPRA
jgi:anthranilate synthase/aminodeoxychorismate synthase-like glutamine amidotransferase